MSSNTPVFVLTAAVVKLEMKLARKRVPGGLAGLQQFKQSTVEYLDRKIRALKKNKS